MSTVRTPAVSSAPFSDAIAEKIKKSINRLNQILPLKANQAKLSAELRQLHREILSSYIEMGRSLTQAEIASRCSHFGVDAEEAIKALNEMDLVVFDEQKEPIGAYPFTMETREHQIKVNGHLVHSMCAMDALSVSPMFDMALEIHSQCRLSGQTVRIIQNGYAIENKDETDDCFFAINWNAASAEACCADSLCTEMIFIKGKAVAEQWCSEEPEQRDIYCLDEAIAFGAGFFVPLMQD